MSFFVQEIPKEIVNATPSVGKGYKWTLEMKILVAIISFILYVLLLIAAKTIYAKQQHLDKMDDLVLRTEEMMHSLHSVDRALAVKLERIENTLYDDDYDVTTEY